MVKLILHHLRSMPRDLVVVSVALFTWGIGEGMFIYFQPIYLQRWSANPIEIGAILSLVGIAMVLAQAPAGFLSDRIGSRPVMWSAWVIGFLATLLMAAAGSLPLFVAGLMLYSSTSFVNVPMNSYIANMRGRWSVERAVTVVSAMMHLGTVAGPALGGWVGNMFGLQMIYRISAAIFLLSTMVIFLARRPNSEEHVEVQASQPNLIANPRFLGMLVMIFFTLFALYLPQPLTSIYLKDQQGISVQAIGQIGSLGSLSNAAIMLALGSLNAPVGMLVGQALVGLFALLLWRGTGLLAFYLGYFFLGGYRLYRSMALAYARSVVQVRETGLAFGLVETANAVSVILAPLTAGLIYKHNPQSVYTISLAVISLMLLVNFLRLPWLKQRSEQVTQAHPSQLE